MASEIIFKSPYPSAHIPEDVSYPEYVLNRIKTFPQDKVAFVDFYTKFKVTFGDLANLSFNISQNLRSKYNFSTGKTLAIFLPNDPMYPVVFLGTSRAGAALTTVNPAYSIEELTKQLVDSNTSFVVTCSILLDKVLKCAPAVPKLQKIFVIKTTVPGKAEEEKQMVQRLNDSRISFFDELTQSLPQGAKVLPEVKVNPKKDIVVIPYSSGTTGANKGALISHYNCISTTSICTTLRPMKFEDVLVGILPLFHIYGMIVIMGGSIYFGTTCVTLPKFEFLDFLHLVQEHKLSVAHLVPPIVLALAKHPAVAKYDLSSLRAIICGAAPLSADLMDQVNKRLPHIAVRQGYGMTESTSLFTIQLPQEPLPLNAQGSCGKLIPNTELKVVDVDTKKTVNVGQEGELVFRGPQIFLGYLNNKEATNETIRDGWLYTGDVGYIDKEGNIFIVDRVKELIKYKGFQVPPAELEAILLSHEKIADAAVIGIAEEGVGETPKAFVVLKPGQTMKEEEVMSFVASKVAHYKRVKAVEFVNVIPKSAAGKILRRLLRDQEKQKAAKAATTTTTTTAPAPVQVTVEGFKSSEIFQRLSVLISDHLVDKMKSVYQFTLKDGKGKEVSWVLDVKSKPGKIFIGTATQADCTIIASDDTFFNLMIGKLSPEKAFMLRKIQIKGKLPLAMKLMHLAKDLGKSKL